MKTFNRNSLLTALMATMALAIVGCNDSKQTAGQKLDRATESVAATTDKVAANAAVAVDDAAITTKVKSAVFAEPGLKSLQINVETKDGVVTLSGTVDTPQLKQRTAQITQNVAGVRSVIDNIAVKSAG